MPLQPRAIHQFHAASAYGDGVTNSMLFIRELLHELGFESEIYCAHIDPGLAHILLPMEAYPDAPDQLLLLHHSLGNNHGPWVESLQSRMVMIYHNITPPEFFPAGSLVRGYSELGRKQLSDWRPIFSGAIGDSPFNTSELLQLGYKDAVTIPLLVNLDRVRSIIPDRRLMDRLDGSFNMVFVGRISENKCQHDVISIFSHLRRRIGVFARLILAGEVSSLEYLDRLKHMCGSLHLGDSVELTGKVSDESLAAIYQRADVFVSMSEHEGFGMPLIEAMAHDVPVIAYNSSNIANTLGEGGILLSQKDHKKTAALIHILSEEPELRRRVLCAQRRNLARFESPVVCRALADFLSGIGISAPAMPQEALHKIPDIRIEGPFDSSYSLAIVNREFARALRRKGLDVSLHDTDGPGDKVPDAAFLANDADCREMWQRGTADKTANILLRDLYPPLVSHMRAPANGLSNYAWEESGFPREYVGQFNRALTHITVLSRYVKKVLLDNGVRVPVSVSGAGIDHLLEVQPAESGRKLGPDGFRFLHISSCFPRKGADVMLESFGRAFTRAEKVSLVIKTFPNIHNDITGQLRRFQERFPDAPPVILINEDISEAEVAEIYARCDALVAPSRGEGFGLPIAEAMLFGKPVITTGFGGQMDFCTPENSWLVDYHFAYAQTHMGQFNSVWAEPDPDDLARQMRVVYEATPGERSRRAAAGRQELLDNFRWEHVAERNLQAIKDLDAQPCPRDLPHIAWVTTWNVRCGIAAYANALKTSIPHGQMIVLANHVEDKIQEDEPFVVRCWRSGGGDSLEGVYLQIRASGASAAVFQFNFGFFDLASFGQLITRLVDDGVGVHIFFHATADIARPGLNLSLRTIAQALSRATRLYVHGVNDLNWLKQLGLMENVVLFPHGVSLPAPMPESDPAKNDGGKLITCFGYMLPGKGFVQLIEAFALLCETHPDLRLEMLNASYPAAESALEMQRCRDAITASGHGDAINLIADFLPDKEVLARLAQSDLIVFPYQNTGESSSAAVRFGLASGRPVACTPLPIFQDVATVTFQLPGGTPAELAEGIGALLGDTEKLQKIGQIQSAWLADHDWQVVSTRLWNIIRGCAVNRQ